MSIYQSIAADHINAAMVEFVTTETHDECHIVHISARCSQCPMSNYSVIIYGTAIDVILIGKPWPIFVFAPITV